MQVLECNTILCFMLEEYIIIHLHHIFLSSSFESETIRLVTYTEYNIIYIYIYIIYLQKKNDIIFHSYLHIIIYNISKY